METFREGVEYAHSLGKKVYITINSFPFNSQIKLYRNHIAKMRDLFPDAFIVSSPGVLKMAKEIAPEIPIHLSTQANVMNYLDAKVYFDMGVKRIIVAKERLGLKGLGKLLKGEDSQELGGWGNYLGSTGALSWFGLN